ncbi:ROK family protein [Inconstantimicrobium mannanitabidum]|uniref:Glucokinase n=1 Tax=Inconstantimicrobium mannanitabidum TaxID=1604901 RepID=A0ACB5R849_9CLOT|nr:ROK family protein [Clostridium sp. TW13]GKX65201.1 glucokinase [Clostridium sp. TW13]
MEEGYVIGIDLGGTKINIALADLNGNIILSEISATEASLGESHIISNILLLIESVLNKAKIKVENIKAIGIGSPGILDIQNGIIIKATQLPFENFNILRPIKEKYNIPIVLQNDANVAALGEYMYGEGRGSKSMVYLTISTGIGGAAIINGELYTGITSNALEIGHTVVKLDGDKCSCGNYGCLETIASGNAIAKKAQKIKRTSSEETVFNYKNITAKEVFIEAENGKKQYINILNDVYTYLGISIANLITLFDPDIVIIGGGIGNSSDHIINKLNEVISLKGFPPMCKDFKIRQSRLKENSGVIGAVALGIKELNKMFV